MGFKGGGGEVFNHCVWKRLMLDGTGRIKEYQAFGGRAEAVELAGDFEGEYAAKRPAYRMC